MNLDFSDIKVLVVGDFMIDHYIIGESNRMSPEAPVPVIVPKEEYSTPGGAGNVAMNLSFMGSQVTCLGAIGNDIFGEKLIKIFNESNISSKHIEIIKENERWIEYDVPKEKIPKYFSLKNRNFKGQRQKWFLARFLGEDHEINLNLHNQIEFTDWTWASYWHPVVAGVVFKRDAYRKVLNDFLSSYNKILKKI